MKDSSRCYIVASRSDPAARERLTAMEAGLRKIGLSPVIPHYDHSMKAESYYELERVVSECKFAIADLSLERPSSYFELGYLEAKNLNIIVIAIAGTSIHQTFRRECVIFYRTIDSIPSLLEQAGKINFKRFSEIAIK